MSFYDDPCVSDSEAAAFYAGDVRRAIDWLRRHYPRLINKENEQQFGRALADYQSALARNNFGNDIFDSPNSGGAQ